MDQITPPSEKPSESALPQSSGKLPKVLIVDDSKAQRKLIKITVEKWGYEVEEAENGDIALEKIREDYFSVIICDWIMPGLTGPEVCQKIREEQGNSYSYLILLTSKNESADIAEGLAAGADDFLRKPYDKVELKARIMAGMRIVIMDQTLKQKTAEIEAAYDELSTVYVKLEKDLIEAGKFQASLIPSRYEKFDWGELSYLFRACGHVGGDLVGHYWSAPLRLSMYSIDVSGHGISSALLTARLAAQLRNGDPANHIAFKSDRKGKFYALSPDEIARRLNERMFNELQTEHYFTMALIDFDLYAGVGQFLQAGHPPAIIMPPNQKPRLMGAGGTPIGLLPDISFEVENFELSPGSSLFLYSDGLTECSQNTGAMLEEEGLMDMVGKLGAPRGEDHFAALMSQVEDFASGQPFDDDISAARISWRGPFLPKS